MSSFQSLTFGFVLSDNVNTIMASSHSTAENILSLACSGLASQFGRARIVSIASGHSPWAQRCPSLGYPSTFCKPCFFFLLPTIHRFKCEVLSVDISFGQIVYESLTQIFFYFSLQAKPPLPLVRIQNIKIIPLKQLTLIQI